MRYVVAFCRSCGAVLYRETWNGPVVGHLPHCTAPHPPKHKQRRLRAVPESSRIGRQKPILAPAGGLQSTDAPRDGIRDSGDAGPSTPNSDET